MSILHRIGLPLCFFAALTTSRAADQPRQAREIRIVGNTVFSTREILGWLSTKPSSPLIGAVIARDLALITDNYRREGYLDATALASEQVVPGDTARADLSIVVHEARRSVVGSVHVSGARRMTEEEILRSFDLRRGDPLRKEVLEEDIDALISRYEKLGYPFARCTVAGISSRPGAESDSLDLALEVDEGRPLTIDEIRVQGNKETRTSVVVRETRIALGEQYNPAKVGAVRERLNRLNIFSSVSEPELYMHGEKGGLLLNVREGSTNTFDGVIGYIPAGTGGQGGYLTGLASVAMRNLFGTGRKLSFHWQREDRFSQEIGVRYMEPWVLDFPVNLGGGFLQRQQDSTYVRRVTDAKAELMLTDELSVSLLFSAENVIPSLDTTVTSVFRSTTTTFGGEISYDSRDDIYSPVSGVRYVTDYSFGRKRLSDVPVAAGAVGPLNASVQRIGIDLELYLSTAQRQVFAFGVHGRETESAQMDVSEMYRYGGANTLRGYRENQFLGSRIAWTNTEYRFLLARRSFFFGFFDTGYYFRPPDDLRAIPQAQAFKYGYGFGIRLDTSLGNLGVSFALGQGDSIGSGKIHFGIINEF